MKSAQQELDMAKNRKDLTLKKKLIKNAIAIYNNRRTHLSNQILTPLQILKRKQYKTKS
jgi:hypothetical protein